VISGFVLRWDTEDLIKARGSHPLMWVDPTDWMAGREELGKIYFDEFVK
jgi:hypothetical protein